MSRRNDTSRLVPDDTHPEPSWEVFLDEETGIPTLAVRPPFPFPVESIEIRSEPGSGSGTCAFEVSGDGRRLTLPVADLDVALVGELAAIRRIRVIEFPVGREHHSRDTLIDLPGPSAIA